MREERLKVLREQILRMGGLAEQITAQEIDFILTAEHLERVADHATNIAEDVILLYEARNLKHAAKLERAEK